MDTINLISIDPGTNIGISIYQLSVPDLKIINIETLCIELSYFNNSENAEINMLSRMIYLDNYIKLMINEYNPHIIAMEAAFVNGRFPRSGMMLSKYIATIEMAIRAINPYIPIYRYAPKMIKMIIGAKGTADKDAMTKAVDKIEEITAYIDPKQLTEHEVDSLAIGYITIGMMRNDPLSLIML